MVSDREKECDRHNMKKFVAGNKTTTILCSVTVVKDVRRMEVTVYKMKLNPLPN